jgi:hypothetical protein
MIAGLFVRPRYGRPLRQLFVRRRPVDEYEDVWYGYDGEDDWDPHQCTECSRWTEQGIFSELDGSFVCDKCVMGVTHAYGGDCG